MAKNGEKWRWRIRLFHLSNSPFFANFWFWNFTFNRLSDSQSSWNFAESLLASIPNKRDPYWMNPSMFWKWLILALWEVGSRDRSKIRLSLIFLKFAGNLDIDSLNRSETSVIRNRKYNFLPEICHLTCGSIWRMNTLSTYKIWGPRPNLPTSRRPIIFKLCRVTTGIKRYTVKWF